jgi:hypothetical protein
LLICLLIFVSFYICRNLCNWLGDFLHIGRILLEYLDSFYTRLCCVHLELHISREICIHLVLETLVTDLYLGFLTIYTRKTSVASTLLATGLQ